MNDISKKIHTERSQILKAISDGQNVLGELFMEKVSAQEYLKQVEDKMTSLMDELKMLSVQEQTLSATIELVQAEDAKKEAARINKVNVGASNIGGLQSITTNGEGPED